MRTLMIRSRLWLLTVVSGGVFVLTGCDPNVRTQILSGVEGAATQLATTFLQAFFLGLANDAAEDQATVVKAVLDQLPQFLA
ncbi:MAG: hypothetical protein ABIG44_08495 [Planctomycetota bacterium]